MGIFARLASIATSAFAGLLASTAILAAAPLAAPHPALWKIENGTSTVFLFGSLHILPRGYAWTTPEFEAAMSASDVFVFEVPSGEQAIADEKAFIVENGLYPRGRSLRDLLTPGEFRRYLRILRQAGLPPRQTERYRPWLASVMLGLAYLHNEDFTALKGADEVIADFAETQGREMRYLETIKEQMELITAGSERIQVRALKRLIGGLSRSETHEEELLDSWSAGDAERFASLIDKYFQGRPEARDFLIDRRNRDWMQSLKAFLESGTTTLVTVGAAHIGGERGLVALLCEEGFDVERIGNGGTPGVKICGPNS